VDPIFFSIFFSVFDCFPSDSHFWGKNKNHTQDGRGQGWNRTQKRTPN
jgi:hypothetical protein